MNETQKTEAKKPTYLQAHQIFRTVRADWDRLDRLIKSPRVSETLKPYRSGPGSASQRRLVLAFRRLDAASKQLTEASQEITALDEILKTAYAWTPKI
jgi:hypothetical protein